MCGHEIKTTHCVEPFLSPKRETEGFFWLFTHPSSHKMKDQKVSCLALSSENAFSDLLRALGNNVNANKQ